MSQPSEPESNTDPDICQIPHLMCKCGKRFFNVGLGTGLFPVIPGIPQNVLGLVGIPLKRAPQAPGDKPSSSRES